MNSRAPKLSISERIAQERSLANFFAKLFNEALQLEAESIQFSTAENQLSAAFVKAGDALKTIVLDGTWLSSIIDWIKRREFVSGLSCEHKYSIAKAGELAVQFRLGSALKSKTQLSIEEINILSTTLLRDPYQPLSNFNNQQRPIWESTAGLILLAAPNQEALSAGLALSQFQSTADYIGDLSALGHVAEVYEISASKLIIATLQANDAIEALLKMKELSFDLKKLNLAGIICQGFVDKVCQACAKEAVIDPKAIVALPQHIQPPRGSFYKVGRGCPLCADRGYSGTLAIYNAIKQCSMLENLVQNNKLEDLEVLKVFRTQGLVSLLEDGVKKAVNGLTTLEALRKLIRIMPDSYLKLAQQEKIPLASLDKSSQSLFAKTSDTQPTILVVEDDPDQREILSMVFKTSGYSVATAVDGVDGFECLETLVPDLVVTDLMMPRMDGREFVNKLKNDPKFNKLPILILTVMDDEDREYDLLNIGADDYCPKTIQRKLLLKRVEKLIRRGRS